jgi:hypothetical protein
MDIDAETIKTLVSACDIDLVLGEISYFLQAMIADAKSEGKTPCLKSDFIEGWMAFKEAQDQSSLLHFIHTAPEYAPMILQYVSDCCPGGRAYNENEIKKLLNRNAPTA